MALETLRGVVALDPTSVQRHRGVIVDCLRDPDASIRKRALELAVALVNADNVRPMVKEMLTYLVRGRNTSGGGWRSKAHAGEVASR